MKALSVRQPYAHNIIFDGKDVENRSWPTNFRGRVLIHASKSMAELEKDERDKYQFGGIIGAATISDCVTDMESPWFYGPYGFVLTDPVPYEFIPCKGALGFFTPDIDREMLRPISSPEGNDAE